MTNLEAIKGKAGYPLSDNSYILALVNRGLSETDTYVIGNLRLLELTHADVICTILTTPNISEGGYSVSAGDKKVMMDLANGIYAKYGESSPLKSNTATFVQRW